MHGRTPPTITSYRGGTCQSKCYYIYIAMTHAWAYPPPLLRHMGGVPANQNVTIYSDDSFMGVPPLPHYYVI